MVLEMRPVTRWLAIGLLVSLTLLLTAWVCWLTEPEAPSQVPQLSDESKVAYLVARPRPSEHLQL